MGISTSLILFAVGAILRFAITINSAATTTVRSTTFNVHTIGVILMVVAAVGLVVSIIFWSSWGGFGGARRHRNVYHRPDGTVLPEDRESRF